MPRTYELDARDQYLPVARHFRSTIARRAIPAGWADRHPVLERYRSWGAIADHLLAVGPDRDELIRALHAHREHVDVQLTVVAGVAHRIRAGAISADMIGHLLTTFAEPDLDTGPGLDVRLRRTARQRAYRACSERWHHRITRDGEVLDHEGEPLRLVTIVAVDDAADHIDDRALLHEFRAAIDRAIAAGELDTATWDTYRAGITRRVDPDRHAPTSPAERMRFMRARRHIHTIFDFDAVAHTA